MKVTTSRFGQIDVPETDIIQFSEGLLGFDHLKKFCIVDPADETLIMWLQSAENPEVAFPILEPKIFKADYKVRLSANELRLLNIDSTKGKDTLVFSILTIPSEISEMTANLKAPLVINTASRIARQVVLQENEYSVKFPIYKEMLAIMMSASAAMNKMAKDQAVGATVSPLSLKSARSKVEVIAL